MVFRVGAYTDGNESAFYSFAKRNGFRFKCFVPLPNYEINTVEFRH